MDYQESDRLPAELEDVAARLREERTTPTPLELDRIKLMVMDRAGQSRLGLYARKKEKWMKSRFALTLVIATGLLMGTSGITMAVTGSSSSGSAAERQYGPPADDNEDGNAALGAEDAGDPVADPADQVATASSDSGSLPFTGFAAIPLLVIGSILLVGGTVLRVRLSRDDD